MREASAMHHVRLTYRLHTYACLDIGEILKAWAVSPINAVVGPGCAINKKGLR